MTIRLRLRAACAVLLLAACGEASDEGAASGAAGDTTSMEGMPGMQGGTMQGGTMMGQMTAQVTAHLEMMEGVSGDSLRAMLPMHRQMVANMLGQMNTEMRQMNMAGDATWNALVDSLRQDLTRMPEMNAQRLEAFMAEHRERVMRLMAMHGRMMGQMPM
jgi:hypothetical protein